MFCFCQETYLHVYISLLLKIHVYVWDFHFLWFIGSCLLVMTCIPRSFFAISNRKKDYHQKWSTVTVFLKAKQFPANLLSTSLISSSRLSSTSSSFNGMLFAFATLCNTPQDIITRQVILGKSLISLWRQWKRRFHCPFVRSTPHLVTLCDLLYLISFLDCGCKYGVRKNFIQGYPLSPSK